MPAWRRCRPGIFPQYHNGKMDAGTTSGVSLPGRRADREIRTPSTDVGPRLVSDVHAEVLRRWAWGVADRLVPWGDEAGYRACLLYTSDAADE